MVPYLYLPTIALAGRPIIDGRQSLDKAAPAKPPIANEIAPVAPYNYIDRARHRPVPGEQSTHTEPVRKQRLGNAIENG